MDAGEGTFVGDETTDNERDDEHFTGAVTEMLLRYLRHVDPDLVDIVLDTAGETRSVEILTDHATWSSYGQVRRLLEAAQPLLADRGGLQQIAMSSVTDMDQPASAVIVQDAGSLAAMFKDISVMSSYIATLLVVESVQIGPTAWLVEAAVQGWLRTVQRLLRARRRPDRVDPRLCSASPPRRWFTSSASATATRPADTGSHVS